MSGMWDIRSSAKPDGDATVRCTDIFQRTPAGKWPIVNEHCSVAPKG